MRSIPVDATKITFLASGKVASKPEYAELSDGSRRRSGNQAKNVDGVPLWVVDCFLDDDEADRAEIVGVTVASYSQPVTPKFQPVTFEGLTATGYLRDGRVAFSFKANGIAGESTSRKAAA